MRSTTVPAISASARVGAVSAMAMPPSQAVDSVISQASQPMPTRRVQTPRPWETLPITYSR
jgi:hypothetical protein